MRKPGYTKLRPGINLPSEILPHCSFKLDIAYGFESNVQDEVPTFTTHDKKCTQKYLTSTTFKRDLERRLLASYSYAGMDNKYKKMMVTKIDAKKRVIEVKGEIILCKCMTIADLNKTIYVDELDHMYGFDVPGTELRVSFMVGYPNTQLVVYFNCN